MASHRGRRPLTWWRQVKVMEGEARTGRRVLAEGPTGVVVASSHSVAAGPDAVYGAVNQTPGPALRGEKRTLTRTRKFASLRFWATERRTESSSTNHRKIRR
ncbi:unnamed protein product [Merluccius merluccius]